MRRSLLAASVSALALWGVASLPVSAAPVPPVNTVFDTPNATVNVIVNSLNTSYPEFQYVTSCSGNTTGNCTPGQRIVESVTNLATAGNLAGSAQVTVTDSAVTAASDVICAVNNYTGNGSPTVANITANAGNFTFYVQNTSNPAVNLSATVPVHCLILNP